MTEQNSGFFSANKILLMITAIGLLVIAIYFQATRFDFINLDDNLYVYSNPLLQNGLNWEAMSWAFTTFWSANWHPLTWLSHGLDIQLFGMTAGSHHAVNIIVHLINSILVFIVFRRMTGHEWLSLTVAALFAVHPAHVESVAWVAERKDVLSTLFWLLTMLTYVSLVKDDKVAGEISPSPFSYLSNGKFWMVFGLLALGLMAKPMLVTLPFVLILCDFWPLGRVHKLGDLWPRFLEKLPLFALSLASCVVTFLAQRSIGAVESLDYLSITTRFQNSLVSYAKYIVMVFYPADLAVFYPYEKDIPSWQVAGAVMLLIAFSALSVWQIRRRPFLLMGWLWFLGTLVPVIGIVQVGSQSLADRYTYIPYIGLFIMIVFGAWSLAGEAGFRKRAFAAAAVVAIAVLSIFAYRQVAFWQNNETLYRHTLAVTTNNSLIEHNLCHYFVMSDRLDEAEPLCKQAIEHNPPYDEPYNTLGILEFKRNNFAAAESDFEAALERKPNYIYPLVNLSQAQARLGKPDEAETSLKKAVDLGGGRPDPIYAPALSAIAAAYAEQGNFEKAVDNLNRAIYIQPNDAALRSRLSYMLYMQGRFDDAESQIQQALSMDQRNADAWNTLGLIKLGKKDDAAAATAFKQVLVIDPKYPNAKENLDRANSGD